jgi:hypothetical protein
MVDHRFGAFGIQPDVGVTGGGLREAVMHQFHSLRCRDDVKSGIVRILDKPADPDFQAEPDLQQKAGFPKSSKVSGFGRIGMLALETRDEGSDFDMFSADVFGKFLQERERGHDFQWFC